MHREPPTTFRGALQILGRDDPPWLNRLNALLGGAIIAAGVAGAAWGAPLFAAAVLSGLWASADQKNEAMALLRSGVDKFAGRLAGTGPYERAELVTAAHTTLVVSSYFEVLHERLDGAGLGGFRLRDAEVKSLASGGRTTDGIRPLDRILAVEVPAPGAASGFWENRTAVAAWCSTLAEDVRRFLMVLSDGLAAAALLDESFAHSVVARYESRYTELAAKVVEFRVWASLGEHAATRRAVRGLGSSVDAALAGQTEALARLEALLGLMSAATGGGRAARTQLHQVNRAVLDQPVFRTQLEAGAGGVRFPPIRDIHLNPRYRICRTAHGSFRPADEHWWAEVPVQPDLDLCLTAHFVSTEATRRPLLLLGHPGAGKSLLTKVLAARLPASAYTVVRVPLRSVGANGRIVAQIQQALAAATNEAVQWRPLVEQSRGAVRVVLLDGLDELLQATPDDRSGYLEDVVAFQETEANLGCPVAVVVTSRTVVADRVDIPDGTVVVKLENFDDDQVGYWLTEWARTNAGGVAGGTVRALGAASALGQPELARQPLLLLMLALYAADPQTPELEAGVSQTELYRRLLDVFARREIGNRATPPKPHEREDSVREALDRLSVAALAMFNRGRQHVTGAELAADLVHLGQAERDVPSDTLPGRRLLGEFFFVHVAEAQAHDEQRRAYEFLHATFGEYLVARRVVHVLGATAEQAFGGSYGRREPDDDLLFALLSHQSLAVSKPTLHFVRGLFANLPDREREWIPRLLDALFARYRERGPSAHFGAYRPVPVDHAREMAAYSANLMLLHTMLAGPVAIADASPAWGSTVALWKAALDADGWQATLSLLRRDGEALFAEFEHPDVPADILHARLVADNDLERSLRYGLALTSDVQYHDDDWYGTVMAAVLPGLVPNRDAARLFRADLPDPVDGLDTGEVGAALAAVLQIARYGCFSRGEAPRLVQWIARTGSNPRALSIFVEWIGSLVHQIDDLPELLNPAVYEDNLFAWAMLRRAGTSERVRALADAVEVEMPPAWRDVDPDLLADIIVRIGMDVARPRGLHRPLSTDVDEDESVNYG